MKWEIMLGSDLGQLNVIINCIIQNVANELSTTIHFMKKSYHQKFPGNLKNRATNLFVYLQDVLL